MYKSRFLQLIVLLSCVSVSSLFGRQIPESQARDYAKQVYVMKSNVKVNSLADIKVTESYTRALQDGTPSYYIFNMAPKLSLIHI